MEYKRVDVYHHKDKGGGCLNVGCITWGIIIVIVLAIIGSRTGGG